MTTPEFLVGSEDEFLALLGGISVSLLYLVLGLTGRPKVLLQFLQWLVLSVRPWLNPVDFQPRMRKGFVLFGSIGMIGFSFCLFIRLIILAATGN